MDQRNTYRPPSNRPIHYNHWRVSLTVIKPLFRCFPRVSSSQANRDGDYSYPQITFIARPVVGGAFSMLLVDQGLTSGS